MSKFKNKKIAVITLSGLGLVASIMLSVYAYGEGQKQGALKYKKLDSALYERAVWHDSALAICALAHRYYNGEGVTKDYIEARKYYKIAANMGEAVA